MNNGKLVLIRLILIELEHILTKTFVSKTRPAQLCELIAGYCDPNRGFTSVVLGKSGRFGESRANNKYFTSMDFAAGAFWYCDAEQSIDKKARDITGHLAKAVKQLPENKKSVIHVGLETLGGVFVENKRYERIVNKVMNFDNSGKDLRWIYCHLFQSYAPPDQDWVYDETIHYRHFNHTDFETSQPLAYNGVLVTAQDISCEWCTLASRHTIDIFLFSPQLKLYEN